MWKWPSLERAWSRNNDLPKEILPSAGWAEDSKSHYLLISLPGFKQDEIKIQVEDDPDRIKISGQRKLGNNLIFFNKTYIIPDNNADIRSTSSKLDDGGIFTVTICKKTAVSPPLMVVQERHEEDHHEAADEVDEDIEKESDTTKSSPYYNEEDMKKKDENHDGVKNTSGRSSGVEEEEDQNSAAEMISKNKGMIFTLLAAFTLGILVSRKVESCRRSNYYEAKLPHS